MAPTSTCTGSDGDRGETQSFSSAVDFFTSTARPTKRQALERHVLPKTSKGSREKKQKRTYLRQKVYVWVSGRAAVLQILEVAR